MIRLLWLIRLLEKHDVRGLIHDAGESHMTISAREKFADVFGALNGSKLEINVIKRGKAK